MNPKAAQCLPGLFLVFLSMAPPARGDAVVLRGRPSFRNVHIFSFGRGRFLSRDVPKEVLHKPLAEAARFRTDRSPMLGSAEALAESNPEVSVSAYRQAPVQATEPWLRDLIRARLLTACDRAGRFDEAFSSYVELLQARAVPPNRSAPCHPSAPGSAENRRVFRHLLAAQESGGSRATVTALRTLTEPAPNPRLTAEALYYVGVAHERLDRAEVATRFYRELWQRADVPAEIQRLAQQGLERRGG